MIRLNLMHNRPPQTLIEAGRNLGDALTVLGRVVLRELRMDRRIVERRRTMRRFGPSGVKGEARRSPWTWSRGGGRCGWQDGWPSR